MPYLWCRTHAFVCNLLLVPVLLKIFFDARLNRPTPPTPTPPTPTPTGLVDCRLCCLSSCLFLQDIHILLGLNVSTVKSHLSSFFHTEVDFDQFLTECEKWTWSIRCSITKLSLLPLLSSPPGPRSVDDEQGQKVCFLDQPAWNVESVRSLCPDLPSHVTVSILSRW